MGLTPPSTVVPNAPVLSSSAISATSVNLSWTDSTTTPNTATSYSVEQLINGTWTAVTTAPGGYTSVAVGGLTLQTTYQFRLGGLNGIGYSSYSNITLVTTSNLAANINFAYGFAGSTTQLTYNGSAEINGTNAQLATGGALQAGSVFSNTPVDVTKFSTVFHFQLTGGSATADGFTFTIQSDSPTALGGPGGGLGYAGDGVLADPVINNSIAIKFDLYNNAGEGTNSTGLYQDGANPTIPATDLTPSGINLHSGDLFQATLTYNGTILTETLLDTDTDATFSQSNTVNIPADTGSTAYVGFTAGTGGNPTVENILDWIFSPNAPAAPAAPSGLGAVVASATSIKLSWTNNATNQTGYSLDRATDPLFTQNLVTQTLPATPAAFTDTFTGLASGGIYYYRIRSINTAGSSVSSNVSAITIPFAPAKATNCTITSVTTSSISLSWTDNAGTTATGYNILRAVNHGTFVLYATLPNLNVSPPSEYDWTDTGLTPGVFYDYHIQCFNIAGYNDFVGGNATTLTVSPSALTAVSNTSGISLSWTAPAGAIAFNIYRGTFAGGESPAPIASGVTATKYLDSSIVPSTTYYYYITATNGNLAPTNDESGGSNECSIKSAVVAAGTSLNFSTGFAGSASQLTYNGGSTISGNNAQITNGASNLSSSIFSTQKMGVTAFVTSFDFNTSAGANTADGFTFCIQNNAPTALGGPGGGLGYGNDGVTIAPVVSNSIAIKFDLYNNAGEGTDSTGLYLNGANPTVPAVDMTSSGVNLHSGDLFQVTLSYDGTTLTELVTDAVTKAAFTQAYTVDVPASTGTAAYVGFTGGTGGYTTTTNILNWTFISDAASIPAAPSGLVGTAVSATSVNLVWTNNAANQTGFSVDRATNSTFTQNLITQALPATPYSFTDTYTGLAAGETYYYRIRAINGAGSSASSATVTVSIPNVPTAATNATVVSVTTTRIVLGWTDNAGSSATGYNILRAADHGAFSLYVSLPALSAPGQYGWSDTALTAGNFYDYQIQCYNLEGYSSIAETSATTLTAPPTGLRAVGNGSSISLTWTAPVGAVSFDLYRGTTADGEAATPIATGITTASYIDSSVAPSTQYYYYVTAVNANIAPLDSSSAASTESSATSASAGTLVKLAGTPIGTGGSFSANSTYAAAFDGDFTTFFDPANASLANWVGQDLGSPQTIAQIKYAPRAGWEFRMYGGQFQASNTADFSSGVVTLYTVTAIPASGQFTTVSVNPGGAYRYIRYVGGTQWVNIAEMEVDGVAAVTAPTVKLTGAAIGVGGNYSPGSTYAAASDGSFTSYFDPANGTLTNWVGLDLGAAEMITQIRYAPRAGFEYRMVSGEFQASNSANFSTGVVTLYTVTAIPVAGQFTTVSVSPDGAYRYVRYTGGTQWVNIAEMEVDGMLTTPPPAAVKLTGTAIGVGGAYSAGSGYSAAFDDNFSTYFDPADGGLTDWVGLDLGSAQTVTQIQYAPRAGYEYRMVGGQFQVSNSANFSTGVVTLATISAIPTAGQFTTVQVSVPGTYRYIRYTSGDQWVNIAEMEVDGLSM
jgi:fibronectin type 3 domain-containing protein